MKQVNDVAFSDELTVDIAQFRASPEAAEEVADPLQEDVRIWTHAYMPGNDLVRREATPGSAP